MKTQNHTLPIIALFLALALEPACGQGVIIQHLGNNNPTSEGFEFYGNGTAGPIPNDLGSMAAWYTSGSGYYRPLTPQENAQFAGMEWVLSATLRIVTPNTDGLIVFCGEAHLHFSSDAENNPYVSFAERNYYLPEGTGSTYNNYQVHFAATGGSSYWINGVQVAEFLQGGTRMPSFLTWGGVNAGQANWNEVSLYVVPEPATVSLILLGGGIFLYVRSRSKKHTAKSN